MPLTTEALNNLKKYRVNLKILFLTFFKLDQPQTILSNMEIHSYKSNKNRRKNIITEDFLNVGFES